jgi:hypothetical protein
MFTTQVNDDYFRKILSMYPEAEAKSEIGSTRYVSDGLVIGIDMFDLGVKYVNIRACHEADAEWLTNLYQYDVKQKLILKDISDVNDKIKIVENQISEFSINYFMDSPCSATYDANQQCIIGK